MFTKRLWYKLVVYIVVASLVCTPLKAFAYPQELGVWTSGPEMPERNDGAIAGVVAGKLIVASERSIPTTSHPVSYNFETEKWENVAPMLLPRFGAAGGAIGDKFYVAGGVNYDNHFINPVRKLEIYDPSTNIWEFGSSIGTYVTFSAYTVANGKLYLIGGYDYYCNCDLNTVWIYDASTNSWSSGAPMPTTRRDAFATSVDGKIYVVGGYSMVQKAMLATLEVYDIETNSWSSGAPMPTARNFMSGGSVQGKLYVVGGDVVVESQPYQSISTSINEVYDIASNSWTVASKLPLALSSAAYTTYDNKIYLLGGFKNSRIQPELTKTMLVYDPFAEQPPLVPQVQFVKATYEIGENEGFNVLVEVRLSEPTTQQTSVQVATFDGTAHAVQDYQSKVQTVTFQPGEVTKFVDIAIIDDTLPEGLENFVAALGSPNNLTIDPAHSTTTVNIIDNECSVTITPFNYHQTLSNNPPINYALYSEKTTVSLDLDGSFCPDRDAQVGIGNNGTSFEIKDPQGVVFEVNNKGDMTLGYQIFDVPNFESSIVWSDLAKLQLTWKTTITGVKVDTWMQMEGKITVEKTYSIRNSTKVAAAALGLVLIIKEVIQTYGQYILIAPAFIGVTTDDLLLQIKTLFEALPVAEQSQLVNSSAFLDDPQLLEQLTFAYGNIISDTIVNDVAITGSGQMTVTSSGFVPNGEAYVVVTNIQDQTEVYTATLMSDSNGTVSDTLALENSGRYLLAMWDIAHLHGQIEAFKQDSTHDIKLHVAAKLIRVDEVSPEVRVYLPLITQ